MPSSSSVGFIGGLSPTHPAYLAWGRVILEWLVLQYFHIHESYHNGWSFRISRFTSYTRMPGPSVFPESRLIPECLVHQYFQIHGPYQNAWSSYAQSMSSDTQNKRYEFRHPKYKFKHPKYKFRHSKYIEIYLNMGKSV